MIAYLRSFVMSRGIELPDGETRKKPTGAKEMKNLSGQWHIHLFGALEVDGPTGERARLNGKKAGELLAFLALKPGQAHSRERLLTLLWGDIDVSHSRTRLR